MPSARSSVLALAAVGTLAFVVGCSSSARHATQAPGDGNRNTTQAVTTRPSSFLRLVERSIGSLAQPVQDAAAAPSGSGALLLGGLTAADTSIGDIRFVSGHHDALWGSLPSARHDAAAVELGAATYVFGGGDATHQLDQIVKVDSLGRKSVVGRLLQPASDVGAAVVSGTAYIVGGFTGSRWLDTIVAWKPGERPHVAARLPVALRYAAVTVADGRLVIAGGSIPSGTASRSVLAFDPTRRRVRKIAELPARTTHAAAAALGGTVYVIGGRGPAAGTPTRRISAIDPVSGRIRPAGALGEARSDLAAIAIHGGILIVGGRAAGGTSSTIGELVPAGARATKSSTAAASSTNIYAADRAGDLSLAAKSARPLVYVPNSQSDTVDEIDPRTFKVVRHFSVGTLPQHVTPSYDLKTLYVLNDLGNSLTPINPRNGLPGRPIRVDDPYNLYFTPDGRYAIVVAERLGRLDFRFPHSFRLHHSLHVPCRGVDHMDFSADGRYLIASCEFSGQLIKVDVQAERIMGVLSMPPVAIPQDVKLSPDGTTYYVADMGRGGVWKVSGSPFRVVGFIRTGAGTHGLYVSRDARDLYITNRGEGSISILDLASGKLVNKWRIPGGGSPDMGNVSASGRVLWVSGRWNDVVYAIDTRSGKLLAKISVGASPHGLCVWPQPGRYSLGHTGILR
ncbi:MAG: kelch repeat-containing protein [Gaiellaceae bacterium]